MPAINYETIWSRMKVRNPNVWPTWPLISPYAKRAQTIIEVGAGSLPKLPIQGTYFLDTSPSCIEALRKKGGKGKAFNAEDPFPYADGFFDLAGAFEVLEHLDYPEKALKEIARVLKKGGHFIFSTPIHQKYFSRWDTFAGHVQRFETDQLSRLLDKEGFSVDHCYVLRLARKRPFPFLDIFYTIGCVFVTKFPQSYYGWDVIFYPFIWILKIMVRPKRFDSLSKVPEDALTLLVVCKKIS